MSKLTELFEKCKTNVLCNSYDDYIDLKFSFAFALNKICNECHGGMGSELYALSSALYLEWDFNPGMSDYDEEDYEQVECFEWLLDELEVRELYEN